MTTVNFSDIGVDKSEILREFQRDTQSLGMSVRDPKNYSKSIVNYLSEDREVSEGAMISFQNGTKVRKNVCCICIWVTQICSLSSL